MVAINYTPLILAGGVLVGVSLLYFGQKMGILQKLWNSGENRRESTSYYINSTDVPKFFEYNGARYPIVGILVTTRNKEGGWEGKISYIEVSGSTKTINITDDEIEIDKEPENIMSDNIVIKFVGSGAESSVSLSLRSAQRDNQILKNKIIVLQEQIQVMSSDAQSQLAKKEQVRGAVHSSRTFTGNSGGLAYEKINRSSGQYESEDDDDEISD